MTEVEWLTCDDPRQMLEFLQGKVSDRKLRLFACVCARQVEEITIRESRISVSELVERYADRQAESTEVQAAVDRVEYAAYGQVYAIGDAFGVIQAALRHDAVEAATEAATWLNGFYSDDGPDDPGRLRPSAFSRDIFGNTFRPAAIEQSWHSETVVALAEGIYQERAFDRMPILADALEDAGCDHADILNHCRQPGEHVRGCWVVDLLTGRK